MSVLLRQLRGIIIVGAATAMIPFFLSAYSLMSGPVPPAYADQQPQTEIVKLIHAEAGNGIYFIPAGEAPGLIRKAGRSASKKTLDAAERLALGLPIDINSATEEELMLIPGIGPVMSDRIIAGRILLGRYDDVNQLTGIKGIKEKTLKKISPYLYVDGEKPERQPR
ncbi:MAG TPA: helix-hairpin-helix domain-containing protein [Smithellaceae bacterium]|nr:helix-hairpin-helix domain-containing protein [Smithellaceae bacterium]